MDPYAPLILVTSLVLDLALGEPRGYLLRIHPVVLCGSIARAALVIGDVRSGIILWLISVVPILLLFTLLIHLTLILNPIVSILVSSYVLKLTYSVRLMRSYVKDSMRRLINDDEPSARRVIQDIVRRSVSDLDREHLVSAVIESAAESLVDGVVSPMIYYALFGLPGALLQRLANTMDSMVGYKGWPYREVGWFSAKVDTVLNYVPARFVGLMVILSSALLRMDWRGAVEVLRTQRHLVGSVNAGWPIAAFAGALGVRLEKPGRYSVGNPRRPLDVNAMRDALRLFDMTLATSFVIILISTLLISLV